MRAILVDERHNDNSDNNNDNDDTLEQAARVIWREPISMLAGRRRCRARFARSQIGPAAAVLLTKPGLVSLT